MKSKGFLFDLDGTLVNSLPVIERSWRYWAQRRGINPQEVLDFIHGKQAITSLRHFMPEETEGRIQEEYRWLEETESTDLKGIAALPGALELLDSLEQQGIPWGIVTSGSIPIAYARRVAAKLPKPAIFVTAEQVTRGKPEPDAYLLGTQKLGLAVRDCTVVEDAAVGVLSGLAAGCQVIAVNVPKDTPKLDKVALNLTSLTQIRVIYDGEFAVIHQIA